MSGALHFQGFEAEGCQDPSKLKILCVGELSLTVEETTAILDGADTTVFVKVSESKLEQICEELRKTGVRVDLLQPKSESNSKSETTVLTLNIDLDQPEEDEETGPKEYFLNMEEDDTSDLLNSLGVEAIPSPFDEQKPTEPEVVEEAPEEKEATNHLSVDQSDTEVSSLLDNVLPMTHSLSFNDALAPTPEVPASELEIGPPPEQMNLTEPSSMVSDLEFNLTAPEALPAHKPVVDISPQVEEPKASEPMPELGLSFDAAPEPAPSAPPKQVKAAETPPPPPPTPKVEDSGMSFGFETEAAPPPPPPAPKAEEKVAQPKSAPKQAEPVKVEEPRKPAVVEKSVSHAPASTDDETDIPTPTPRKGRLATDDEHHVDKGLSKNQLIAIVLLGSFLIVGLNYFITPKPETPQLPLSTTTLELGEIDTKKNSSKDKQEKKAPTSNLKTYNVSTKVESITFKTTWTIESGKGTFRLLADAGPQPELSPEEIVNNVKPKPWLKKLESDSIAITSQPDGTWVGDGTAFGYVEQGPKKMRLVSKLHIEFRPQTSEEKVGDATLTVQAGQVNNAPESGIIWEMPEGSVNVLLRTDITVK